MSLIEKLREFNAAKPVAPKLSKAKATAAAKELAKTNPNRARIEGAKANLKAKLFKNVKQSN
jgi:hypothetical protein